MIDLYGSRTIWEVFIFLSKWLNDYQCKTLEMLDFDLRRYSSMWVYIAQNE